MSTDDSISAATTDATTTFPSVSEASTPQPETLHRRPRGHPRKYHTANEKAVAHALAQQEYYQRNRRLVCKKAHRRYTSASDNHEQGRHHVVPKEPRRPRHAPAAYLVAPKPATLDDWKVAIAKNWDRLTRRLDDQTLAILAAAVYARTCETNVTDPSMVISDALEPFNKLHNRISVISTSIYRRIGCIQEWKEAEKLCSNVQEVVYLLQDLLCSALSGVAELKAAWRDSSLAYQQILFLYSRAGLATNVPVTQCAVHVMVDFLMHPVACTHISIWGLIRPFMRLEKYLDRMGGQKAKNDLAMYHFMCSIPIDDDDSLTSSSHSNDSNERSSSEEEEDTSIVLSSRSSHATSILGWADDGCDNNPVEWERLNVDACVAAMGYDELDVHVPVTSMTSLQSHLITLNSVFGVVLFGSTRLANSNMRRIKRPRFSVAVRFTEEELEETVPAPAPVRLRHTDYYVLASGRSSRLRAMTTYHDAPPSSPKARSSLHDPVLDEFARVDLSWLDGPMLEEENSDSDSEEEDADAAMDPGASPEDADVHQDDSHFRDWLPLTWDFLEEMFRHEHPRQFRSLCARCQAPATDGTLYRCVTCNECFMYYEECMVSRHYGNPLHRIQEWTGTFFKRTTLAALGLVLPLGHDPDTCCPTPCRGRLQVLDLEGIQTVHVDWCECTQSQSRWRQLLCSHFFPSTVVHPQMATTFWTLEVFHLLSFMSKVSGYEFYHTLVRLTDNTEPVSSVHVDGISPGQLPVPAGALAVKCPACPWPGINLDEGWERDTVNPWKYSLFLTIDANFRLVQFVVSNAARDPSLVNGAGFVVAQDDFRKHVAEYGKRIPFDPSDCRDHQAVKLATSKRGAGLATSGVATVDCARHDAKGPAAVTILDHGEEQVWMDYIFCSRMQQATPERIVVSYDINCQWSKKLWERMAIYPSSMMPHQDPGDFVYLIPKFHLPAHIPSCHVKYSFNKTPFVGETDGEAPERSWSRLNQLAASLKVMDPGGYLNTLDDHIGDYNYRKTALMGSSLLKAMLEAIPARTLHSALYAEFTASLPIQDVQLWIEAIEAWERDPEAVEIAKITAREIREHIEGAQVTDSAESMITEADSTGADSGVDIFAVRHEVSPSTMILQGVELESDQQRLKLAHAALGAHSTDRDRAKVTEGLNRLRRHMDAWFEVQQVYMPGVVVWHAEWNKAQLLARSEAEALRAEAEAEAPQAAGRGRRKKARRSKQQPKVSLEEALDAMQLPLFLPSACLVRLPQNAKLMDFEFRLREAEAYECLTMMRRLLIYRSHLYKFKDKHVTGQMMTTTRYRKLRNDLVVLADTIEGGKLGWDRQLRELNATDVRPLEEVLPGEMEGRWAMSWIWRIHHHETDAEETAEALRIEWCKTRAWAHRWREEVILLEEEMKRVKAFFAWEGRTWLARAHCIDLWVNVPIWLSTGVVPVSKRGRPRKPKISNLAGGNQFAPRSSWSTMSMSLGHRHWVARDAVAGSHPVLSAKFPLQRQWFNELDSRCQVDPSITAEMRYCVKMGNTYSATVDILAGDGTSPSVWDFFGSDFRRHDR
ncbi:hypothetical protein EV421DRAFT_1737210 [Armillaria borealis]|uniref:CxC2-like cysteine cluster KDZ transposase-associated domain-containing protein n=1 Tax=Armillaria borealis TaxID=47425 RepID=A0AA39JFT6_9AGAR|nr:hypothetical protein EV421DRAFT_1737210 [Armillaria borealis]